MIWVMESDGKCGRRPMGPLWNRRAARGGCVKQVMSQLSKRGKDIAQKGRDFPANSTTVYYTDDLRTLGECLGLQRPNYANSLHFLFYGVILWVDYVFIYLFIYSHTKHLLHNYCVLGTVLAMKIERRVSSRRDRY